MIPWTIAHQAPLSVGCSRQAYWRGLPFSSPGNLPDPGIKPASLTSTALAGGFFTTEPPGKPVSSYNDINPIMKACPLMTSSEPNYLPKASPPNTSRGMVST